MHRISNQTNSVWIASCMTSCYKCILNQKAIIIIHAVHIHTYITITTYILTYSASQKLKANPLQIFSDVYKYNMCVLFLVRNTVDLVN